MNRERTLTFLIMAGGTGGHIYPALAVAKDLIARGHNVVWLGVRQGLEATIVPSNGIEIRFVSVTGLRRRGAMGWLSAPLMLTVALCQCLAVVAQIKPNAVMGMGGYVSGPGAIAAWLLRKPLLIHEQNSVLGFTNRWLKQVADVIMEAFPGTFGGRRGVVHTGNPVRETIANIEDPKTRLAGRSGPIRLLVLGGSQGALALNKLVPNAIRSLDSLSISVLHQAGAKTFAVAAEAYGEQPDVEVIEFIEDMARAYAWADIVVCRAGAMTVAELACAGVPSVLIPFPYAVDDHQTTNARFLSDAKAAVLVQEKDLAQGGLSTLLSDLLVKRERLFEMARIARSLAKPNATRDVATLCMEAANA